MNKLLTRVARQSPALIVAMLALFVALTGTAVATTSALITGKSIKNGSITGLDIKNKSVTAADIKGQLRGARGLPGAPGAQGAKGDKGDKGDRGEDITVSSTLKPWETIYGPWGVSSGSSTSGYGFFPIEFRPHLAADLPTGTAHYLEPGTTSAQCPGQKQAAAGHLCVYGSYVNNMTFGSFSDPQTTGSGVRAMGTVMYLLVSGSGGFARGTWALTAPATSTASGGVFHAGPASPRQIVVRSCVPTQDLTRSYDPRPIHSSPPS